MEAATAKIPDPPVVEAFRAQSISLWAALILISGIPRILGAFLLPNAFGDAYAYLNVIEAMRGKMADGTFSISDLHDFWLPLYQFVCAAISLLFGHSFYVSKLVSAVCGVGVCLLVFRLTLHLTGHLPLSLLAFAAVSVSPLHILYSASALTDIPHALLVAGSLCAALEKRWKTAAIFAAAAGFVRVESWMLMALLPALQWLIERRVSLAACGIMLASPLLWFYICWKATGNPLAYFEIRNRYVMEYTAANPTVATFSLSRLRLDAERLFASTNRAALAGCLVAAWIVAVRVIRQGFGKAFPDLYAVTATGVFFFSNLGFLLFAYFTGNQPDIWSRYGLLFFVLGLPVLAWAFRALTEERPRWKYVLSAVIAVVFLLQAHTQVQEVMGCVSDESAKSNIASYLKDASRSNPDLRILCEDGGVQFLSGIPRARFAASYNLPADSAQLLNRLRQDGVECVVSSSWEVSTLTKLFPGLNQGRGNDVFQLVMSASSKRSNLAFWVYRLR